MPAAACKICVVKNEINSFGETSRCCLPFEVDMEIFSETIQNMLSCKTITIVGNV